MEILNLDNVKKEYGTVKSGFIKRALDGVTFSVRKGEFTGIMGPSGAGKTTLLNMISTIDNPTSGEILIDSKSVKTLKGNKLADFRRDKLGFIFQEGNLLDTLTVRDNIILPLSLQGVKPKEAMEKVESIAMELGIYDILDKYPVENSGGQKQRAAVARAIVSDPSLILADEPTGALDSNNSRSLMASLKGLQEKKDATVLVVTHDPMVASFCNRIIFLKDGKLFSETRKSGSREDFFGEIINVLAVMEGSESEVFSNSLA